MPRRHGLQIPIQFIFQNDAAERDGSVVLQVSIAWISISDKKFADKFK
jgi:hypothetical protein